MINLIEFQLQFNTAALMSILTYSAMSQFWVSSQPPPSDISVPWIILAKQWTKRGTFNQNLINIQYYLLGHYPIQSETSMIRNFCQFATEITLNKRILITDIFLDLIVNSPLQL